MAGEYLRRDRGRRGQCGLTAALAAAAWREPMRPTLQRRTAHRIVEAAKEMTHDNRHH